MRESSLFTYQDEARLSLSCGMGCRGCDNCPSHTPHRLRKRPEYDRPAKSPPLWVWPQSSPACIPRRVCLVAVGKVWDGMGWGICSPTAVRVCKLLASAHHYSLPPSQIKLRKGCRSECSNAIPHLFECFHLRQEVDIADASQAKGGPLKQARKSGSTIIPS